jgi:hypothetical protein
MIEVNLTSSCFSAHAANAGLLRQMTGLPPVTATVAPDT